MQDRPTANELLAAISDFLSREVQPRLDGRTQYHLRVALNLVKVLQRELAGEPDALQREWAGLKGLAVAPPLDTADLDGPPTRECLLAANKALCAAIRAGSYDPDAPGGSERRAKLYTHLRSVLADQLRIANPEFLERVAERRST